MTENTKNDTQLYAGMTSDGEKLRFSTTNIHKEKIDETAEELGINSRSEAIRLFIEVGRKQILQNNPKNTTSPVGTDEATTIREMIPEGKENAVDIRDELPEIIDDELIQIVEEDSEINRDGWEVYR